MRLASSRGTLGLVTLWLCGLLLAGCTATAPTATPTPLAVQVTPSAPPSPTPTPTPTPAMLVVIPSQPVRIEIPSVGIDSVIVPIEAGTDTLDPDPKETRPVWPTNLGDMPGGGHNGTYIVGHSSRYVAGSNEYEDTVFNKLFDRWVPPEQQSNVHIGDPIYVTTKVGQRLCSTVTYVNVDKKSTVASSPDLPVWNLWSYQTAVITCAQSPADLPSVNQLVIIADLGGSGCK